MKKWISLALISLLGFTESIAQTHSTLNTANFFAYDILYHNPAGIAFFKKTQAMVGMQFLHAGLAGDNLRNNLASYAQLLGDNGAAGLRAFYFTSNVFQQGNFSVLFGRKFFGDALSLGLNANLLAYSYDSDKFQGFNPNDPVVARGTAKNVFSYGLGFLFQPTWRLSFGASVDHLNRPDLSLINSGFKKSPVYKFGMSLQDYLYMPQIDLKIEDKEVLFQGGIRRGFREQKLNVFAGYAFSGSEQKDIFAELNFLRGQIGLSYVFQYPLTGLNQISSGSHRFNFLFSKGGFAEAYTRPVISLINPKKEAVNSPIISVKGHVSYPEGLTALEIARNGRLQRKFTYGKSTTEEVKSDVLLDEGKNMIEVTARAGRVRRSKTFEVTYTPDFRPPLITLLSSNRATADSGKYRLHAQISDNRGLVNARIFLNGEKIESIDYPGRNILAVIDEEIDLTAKLSHIQFIARNDKKESVETVLVEYRNAPSAATSPQIVVVSPKEKESHYSIVQFECAILNIENLNDVTIKLNGVPLETQELEMEKSTDDGVLLRTKLDLQPGSNRIEVSASNSQQDYTNEDVEIFYRPAIPLYRKTWAVIIGINSYYDSTITKLDFAESDAQGVEQVLRDEFGFDHFIPLYGRAATRERITAVLRDSLKQTHEDDAVVVFFAGHGFTQKTPADTIGGIVPYDGTLESSFALNIDMEEIRDMAKYPKAKHIYYVIDACYSGLLLVKSRGATQPPANIDYDFIKEISLKRARDVLTAGEQGEKVIDRGPGNHSVFTHRLLEGLRGAADSNSDSCITANELGLYVKAKVPEDAKRLNGKQTPQFGKIIEEGGDFVFFRKLKKD